MPRRLCLGGFIQGKALNQTLSLNYSILKMGLSNVFYKHNSTR